jgi:hypothetical protein
MWVSGVCIVDGSPSQGEGDGAGTGAVAGAGRGLFCLVQSAKSAVLV